MLSSPVYFLIRRGGTYLWHLFIFLFRGHLFLCGLQGQKDRDEDCTVSFLWRGSPAFPDPSEARLNRDLQAEPS